MVVGVGVELLWGAEVVVVYFAFELVVEGLIGEARGAVSILVYC